MNNAKAAAAKHKTTTRKIERAIIAIMPKRFAILIKYMKFISYILLFIILIKYILLYMYVS